MTSLEMHLCVYNRYVHSNIIHNTQNNPIDYQQENGEITLQFIYTMVCYRAIKRNVLLIHVAKWKNLINEMWNETNYTQNNTYHKFLSI